MVGTFTTETHLSPNLSSFLYERVGDKQDFTHAWYVIYRRVTSLAQPWQGYEGGQGPYSFILNEASSLMVVGMSGLPG